METEKRTSFQEEEEEEEEEEGFESFFHPAFSFFLRKIAVSRCITQRDTQLPFPPTFSRARNPEESKVSPGWKQVYTHGSPVPFLLSRENGRQDGNPSEHPIRVFATELRYVTLALISVDVHASRYLWGSVLLAVSVRLGRFWDADTRRSVG